MKSKRSFLGRLEDVRDIVRLQPIILHSVKGPIKDLDKTSDCIFVEYVETDFSLEDTVQKTLTVKEIY